MTCTVLTSMTLLHLYFLFWWLNVQVVSLTKNGFSGKKKVKSHDDFLLFVFNHYCNMSI